MNTKVTKQIKDKIILITGGTGSFGHGVIGRLLQFAPKKIIIFSRDEKKQHDMRIALEDERLKFVIGDVRDREGVNRVVEGVDYVFHAAALKQVPTCEFFPMEAVKTNVIGTHHVLGAAAYHKVKSVVVLSTDKAVYPINAMGMTKALMEKTMIAESKNYTPTQNSKTVFCGVRYGNVLYTRGSVLPYFISLLKQNKELRVTNPQMTRFLLPLWQAVDLVLFAITNGENGCLYVKNSPASTIDVLARAVCSIFKYEKGWTNVGIRAGEKMHETLISREEFTRTEDLGEYYKIRPETEGLNYDKYLVKGNKNIASDTVQAFTSENAKRLDLKETVALLRLLPELQKELEQYQ